MFFKESSGFVYGAMTSFSGFACGVILMVIQYYMPDVHQNSTLRSLYFKWIIVYGCGGLSVFGTLITAILCPMKICKRYLIIFQIFDICFMFGNLFIYFLINVVIEPIFQR